MLQAADVRHVVDARVRHGHALAVGRGKIVARCALDAAAHALDGKIHAHRAQPGVLRQPDQLAFSA